MSRKLRAWRKAKKLSQTEVAKLFGVDQSLVSKWEIEAEKIGLDRVPHISKITGIPRIELRPDKPSLFG